jgi:MFS family permease
MGGTSLLLLYATEGPTLGWLSLEEIAFLVTGAILFVGFFFFENKRANPMIQLGLLKIRNVLVANMVGIISGVTMFTLFFALIYYTQLPTGYGLNLGIIQSGLTLAPSTLGMLIGGPLIGKLTQRYGPKPALLLGSALTFFGELLFLFNRGTNIDVALDMFVAMAGVVSIIVPIVNMLTIALPQENIAVGLGMNTMLRNLGGAVGPVVATVIITTYTTQYVVGGHAVPGVYFPTIAAFNYIFLIGTGLIVLVAAISLATKNYTFRNVKTTSKSDGDTGYQSK